MKLDEVKLGEVFRYLSSTYDLEFHVGDKMVWVVDVKGPKRMGEAPGKAKTILVPSPNEDNLRAVLPEIHTNSPSESR